MRDWADIIINAIVPLEERGIPILLPGGTKGIWTGEALPPGCPDDWPSYLRLDLSEPQAFGYGLRWLRRRQRTEDDWVDGARWYWDLIEGWTTDETTDADRVVLAEALVKLVVALAEVTP